MKAEFKLDKNNKGIQMTESTVELHTNKNRFLIANSILEEEC